MGATEKLSDMGFAEEDLDELVKVTGESPMSRILLPLAPIAVDEKTTREIFRDSLHPLQ
jgi:alcohol dehydrogenase class IV